MFEAEVRIPDEKDLIIQTYDWDLIGSDDKVGETVVDLENRYFTRFNAWCGLPSEYEMYDVILLFIVRSRDYILTNKDFLTIACDGEKYVFISWKIVFMWNKMIGTCLFDLYIKCRDFILFTPHMFLKMKVENVKFLGIFIMVLHKNKPFTSIKSYCIIFEDSHYI